MMVGIIVLATKFTACVTVVKKPQRFTMITKNHESNLILYLPEIQMNTFLIGKSAYLIVASCLLKMDIVTPNKNPFALFGMILHIVILLVK